MHVQFSPPLPRRNKRSTLRPKTKEPSIEEILIDVCRCFNVPVEMVKSTSQYYIHVIPRRIYCYVAHVLTNDSCSKISGLINRDHSTYVDRVDQCLGWFKIKEPGFMEDWDTYTRKSQIWREYYQLKLISVKTAA